MEASLSAYGYVQYNHTITLEQSAFAAKNPLALQAYTERTVYTGDCLYSLVVQQSIKVHAQSLNARASRTCVADCLSVHCTKNDWTAVEISRD